MGGICFAAMANEISVTGPVVWTPCVQRTSTVDFSRAQTPICHSFVFKVPVAVTRPEKVTFSLKALCVTNYLGEVKLD